MPAETNMREVDGLTFYAIRRSDRQFAKAMGLDVQVRTPWDSAPVLGYIKGLRNQAIDDAILKAADDDNAADAEHKNDKRPRYERCSAVPSVIEIEIPQMECEGYVVQAHVMKVASTANYGFVLEFELTVANVEYLYNAFAASPPSYFDVAPAARKKRRCYKHKPMYPDTPDVVEIIGPYGALAKTAYVDINGQRRQHSRRIRVLEEHHLLGAAEQKRREVALDVQQFKDDHHHADAGGCPIEPID